MRFSEALDAIIHAAAQASSTGKPWCVVHDKDRFIAAPLGRLSSDNLLEVCQP
jgi:hypothetical protein